MDLPIGLALFVGAVIGTWNAIRGFGDVYFDGLSSLVFLLLIGRWIQFRQQHQAGLQALLTIESNKIALRRVDLQNALNPTIREQWLLNALKKAKNSTEQLTILATALRELSAWQWSRDFTLVAMSIYQHPQLQNSQSYEVERRLLPQLLDNLAVCGEASLSLQANQYPTVVLIAWKFKLEMRAALSSQQL